MTEVVKARLIVKAICAFDVGLITDALEGEFRRLACNWAVVVGGEERSLGG
jgi:hypothetical protein